MSDGNRDRHGSIIAFAVTICLLTVALIGWYEGFKRGQESHQSASSEAYAEQAQGKIESTCVALPFAAQNECIAEAISSEREQQRAEQDLDAQQQMAEWARWMLIATVVMASITGFGVVFVWQTLEATRTMADDTREIGKAQVKAYVYVTDLDIFAHEDIIRLKIKNFGNSPASVQFVDVKCHTFDSRTGNPGMGGITTSKEDFRIEPQGTKDAILTLSRGVGRFLLEIAREGSGSVTIEGSVQYTDVFKDREVSGFTFDLHDHLQNKDRG
jgi:hypothetical protein